MSFDIKIDEELIKKNLNDLVTSQLNDALKGSYHFEKEVARILNRILLEFIENFVEKNQPTEDYVKNKVKEMVEEVVKTRIVKNYSTIFNAAIKEHLNSSDKIKKLISKNVEQALKIEFEKLSNEER